MTTSTKSRIAALAGWAVLALACNSTDGTNDTPTALTGVECIGAGDGSGGCTAEPGRWRCEDRDAGGATCTRAPLPEPPGAGLRDCSHDGQRVVCKANAVVSGLGWTCRADDRGGVECRTEGEVRSMTTRTEWECELERLTLRCQLIHEHDHGDGGADDRDARRGDGGAAGRDAAGDDHGHHGDGGATRGDGGAVRGDGGATRGDAGGPGGGDSGAADGDGGSGRRDGR